MGKIIQEKIALKMVEKPLAIDDMADPTPSLLPLSGPESGPPMGFWAMGGCGGVWGVFTPGVGLIGVWFWLSIAYEYNHPLLVGTSLDGCAVCVRGCATLAILVILGRDEYVKPGWPALDGWSSAPPPF